MANSERGPFARLFDTALLPSGGDCRRPARSADPRREPRKRFCWQPGQVLGAFGRGSPCNKLRCQRAGLAPAWPPCAALLRTPAVRNRGISRYAHDASQGSPDDDGPAGSLALHVKSSDCRGPKVWRAQFPSSRGVTREGRQNGVVASLSVHGLAACLTTGTSRRTKSPVCHLRALRTCVVNAVPYRRRRCGDAS